MGVAAALTLGYKVFLHEIYSVYTQYLIINLQSVVPPQNIKGRKSE